MTVRHEMINVTKSYDKIEILSVPDEFPQEPMGGIAYPLPDHTESFTGTPAQVMKHIQGLRKKNHDMTMKIDGAAMSNYRLCEYYIGQVARGAQKVFEVEITRFVKD